MPALAARAEDSRPSRPLAAGVATVLRLGLLVGLGILTGDRFAERMTTRPWLLAVTGLAVATLLIVARMAVARLVVATGVPAARLPLPAGAAPGAPLPRDRP